MHLRLVELLYLSLYSIMALKEQKEWDSNSWAFVPSTESVLEPKENMYKEQLLDPLIQ